MKSFSFGRYVLSGGAAVALLAGCGGSQSQVEPAALKQNVTQSGPGAAPTRIPFLDKDGVSRLPPRHHGQSWMARRALRMGPLLYISDDDDNFLYVFSLPGGKLVGKITGFQAIRGACSDKEGNVFVVDYEASSIKEYRHGAKEPIAVLNDPDGFPWGCSVDPTTGNLAVANLQTVNGSDETEPGDVSIYTNAKGKPRDYADPGIAEIISDSYDTKGNLYVSGVEGHCAFVMLHKGSSKLKGLYLNHSFDESCSVQWDNRYLAVANVLDGKIYRFIVNGTKGTKVGTTRLAGVSSVSDFWIQNHELYAPVIADDQSMVGLYSYPSGGKPTKTLLGFASAFGATVSVLP